MWPVIKVCYCSYRSCDIVGFFPCHLSLFPVAYSLCFSFNCANTAREGTICWTVWGEQVSQQSCKEIHTKAPRLKEQWESMSSWPGTLTGKVEMPLLKPLSVSALALLYHSWKSLIAEFAQFLSLTCMIFAEEEEMWWECYRNTLFIFR